MALTLFNTLSGQKEPFRTSDPQKARIYVCGPTVYDYAHLGHARCYVVYDVLVRHLRASGIEVQYVRNITDIDDKIVRRSAECEEEMALFARRFEDAYREDMQRLGNLDPNVEPRVSDHLDEIRALISRLIEQGIAYESNGDVYFSVQAFPDYGKLSHRRLDEMEAGGSGRVREEESQRKRHPADFALWKRCLDESEAAWPSPWGRGRPGWHIECSAMSMKYLGESFDLHGGGLDLVFPHHENEIAQSEAATGKPFATCWMHNGFVEVDREKMSKSLGNFFTIRELFERVEAEALRYALLGVHYRSPLHLDWRLDEAGNVVGFPQFEEAERRLAYVYATRRRVDELAPGDLEGAATSSDEAGEVAGLAERLQAALDDDLNTPVALAQVAEFLSKVNEHCDRVQKKRQRLTPAFHQEVLRGFSALGRSLGLGLQDPEALLLRIRSRRARALGLDPQEVDAKIEARRAARAAKDYALADQLRQELSAWGVELQDGAEGTRWSIP